MEQVRLTYVWTLPAAGVVCFVAGFLFGLPALRLEGLYLALATFALAIAMPQVLKYSPLEHWTGGVQGIVIIKPDAPFGLPLNPDQWLYFFTLAVAIVMYRLRRNLVREPHRPRADRDPRPSDRRERDGHQRRALQVARPSASARSTPASPARSARSSCSSSRPTASPSFLSITLLVGLVVGGVGSIPGALFGGAVHPVRAEHRRASLEGGLPAPSTASS